MIAILEICLLASIMVSAQPKAADQEALHNTLMLLQDQAAREAAIAKDPEAKKADAYAKQVGGANTEEVYALSAKLFEKLVVKYGSDMTKLQEVLQRALQNPKGFVDSEFGPEEVRALKGLAEKVPAPTQKTD